MKNICGQRTESVANPDGCQASRRDTCKRAKSVAEMGKEGMVSACNTNGGLRRNKKKDPVKKLNRDGTVVR